MQCACRGVHLSQGGLDPVLALGSLPEETGDPDHQTRAHDHLEPGCVQDRIRPGTLNEADFQDQPAQEGTGHAQTAFQTRVLSKRDDDLDHQHQENQARNGGGHHVRPTFRKEWQRTAQDNGQWRHIAKEPGTLALLGGHVRMGVDEHPVQQPGHGQQRQ